MTLAIVGAVAAQFFLPRDAGVSAKSPRTPTASVENAKPDSPPVSAPAGELTKLSSALEQACRDDITLDQDYEPIYSGSYAEWQSTVADQLADSSSPEHLHLAALMASEPAQRLELITRAVDAAPAEPFILWSAVRLCRGHADTGCPLDDWLDRLTLADSENSLVWSQLAMHRHQGGDKAAALDALRRGASSTSANSYWIDTVMLSAQSLAAATNLSFLQRVNLGFGISAAQVPAYGDLANTCTAEASDPAWAFTCIDFGRQLELEARSELGNAFGLVLQQRGFEALGDAEAADKARERQNARRQRMQDAREVQVENAFLLISASPSLFEAYLERIRSEGEIAGAISFNKDLRAFREQRPDLACY